MRLLALFLLLFMCSCQQREELIQESQQILFSANEDDISSDTKGSNITADNFNSMAVYGYYSSQAHLGERSGVFMRLFDNEKLTCNSSGVWSYASPKYWMVTGNHHFFAFAPYDGLYTISHMDESYPVMSFDVPLRAKDQIDLLWSLGKTVNITYLTDSPNKVHFNMQHALTRITLSGCVSPSYSGGPVKIEKVVFKDLYRTGKSHLSVMGQNITEAKWDNNLEVLGDFLAQATVDGISGELKDDLWLTQDMQSLLNDEEAFFLMPQSFDGRESHIEIHFRSKIDQVLHIVDVPLVAPINHQGVLAWEPGQAIDYKLRYNGSENMAFILEGSVVPWDMREVDLAISATYLNVGSLFVSLTSGEPFRIYFATDGYPVSQSCEPILQTSLFFDSKTDKGYIELPATAPKGTYRLTIQSGGMSRYVTVFVN